jgi:ribosome-associated protein
LRTEQLNGAATPAKTSPSWLIALRAAESKKASAFRILDLREVTSFADYFLICNGTNPRQNQAIWDEIALRMKKDGGEIPVSVEGYENAEWILGDYGDFLVHVFTPDKRTYYDLERLWRHATDVPVPSPNQPEAA